MEEARTVVNKGSKDHPDLINLPPGFRFHPTDEEIITYYLTEKVVNGGFTSSAIGEADLNKCEPWDLPKKAKMGEKEWYFFCQKDRKYPTGMRTNRATESGYWKATGKDKEIYKGKECLIGMKKTLVFYGGRAPKGEKTNWVMHEYRLEGKFSHCNLPRPAKDEWAVCRVFHKNMGANNNSNKKLSPQIQGLTRINSLGVDDMLDCSNSLPPLTDDPPYDNSSDDFKGSTRSLTTASEGTTQLNTYYSVIAPSNMLQYQQHNRPLIHHSPLLYSQIMPSVFPNPCFPNSSLHGSSNQLGYFQQGIAGSSSPSFVHQKQCKAEQFSMSNQSVISVSQDTGVSTDMNNTTDISSVASKEEMVVSNHNRPSSYGHDDFEGPSSSVGQISDIEGLIWDDL